jgi:Tfp pilus assembly pilus retraction ATPase PilT
VYHGLQDSIDGDDIEDAVLPALPPHARPTISRIADSFPSAWQNTIRQELAMALTAVMTQTLLPKTGGGVVPAAELLMISYGTR